MESLLLILIPPYIQFPMANGHRDLLHSVPAAASANKRQHIPRRDGLNF
jgi:hypothetical protein